MTARRVAWAAVAALLFAGFFALGTWQVERRAWKRDLVARVDARVHAAPVPAPGPASWPQVGAATDAYRRVQVTGRYLHDREVRVQASTALGAGFWVLTPFRTTEGFTVLVNRGFVPPPARDAGAPSGDRPPHGPEDDVTVTGLLRISEPGGGFLRRNDPAGGRWYSRDVEAIGEARGLAALAPYFIDADRGDRREPDNGPVGGLTVIAFADNHLVYALTWYALALMVVGAAWRVVRRGEDVDHD